MGFSRTDCNFVSHGDNCSARLYMPEGVAKPPLIVMAHGFGGLKNCGLEPFAELFANNGFAVLLFDYRGFGESQGNPRQLISPRKHIEDYLAAVKWARELKDINPGKIALWGTSYSGGHAIAAAAKDQKIAAVSVQVPFVDGLASAIPIVVKNGPGYFFKAVSSALKDFWMALTARRPYLVPICGAPNEFAVLNTRDSKTGYESLIPAGFNPINATPARVFLSLPLYRPVRLARRVKCPALIIAGENDSLIPIEAVKKTAAKIKRAEFVSLPIGHFAPYSGETFESVSQKQLEFFKAHL